ncbi:MAG: outer membrane lipoprotein carrier protein LolA [Xanthobacteraceae bacterium]|uniref:outer membrane lipoprotein carrier protein LolA n=1 Tax=Pseudolabrys sp. TaxID=1960880 RepID=UPI003D0BB581
MARRSTISAGLAALLAALTAMPVLAQSVPVPSPRPPVAAATRAPATTGSTPAIMAQTQQAQAPAPATNPFAAVLGKTASPGALTPQQRAIIDRVSGYLSSIQVMTGQFVQVGPDGRRSEGEIYIQKPGKLRFEYDPPSPIEIISDGGSVVVRDRKLATQDVYPLSQTPLRFLLADRLDLLKDTNLTAVYADDVFITVVVEETHGIVGKSRMMIMFGAKDTQLKQWTVTDPQGYDTTVAVYNLDFTKRPDPNLFKIDYTQYKN